MTREEADAERDAIREWERKEYYDVEIDCLKCEFKNKLGEKYICRYELPGVFQGQRFTVQECNLTRAKKLIAEELKLGESK